MYCQNCGTELKENDRFCGKCGASMKGTSVNLSKDTYENVVNNLKDITYSQSGVISILKTYAEKPITIFEKFKDKDVFGASIALAILLPIIYGILSILYSSELVSGIIKIVKKMPSKMADMGFLTPKEATEAMLQMQMDSGFIKFVAQVENFIDKSDIFKYASLCLLMLIIVTLIILAIVNNTMLRKELNLKSMLFIVTLSYIPVIVAFVIQLIVGLISIRLSFIMIPIGLMLTIVSLYNGLCQYTTISKDKIFLSLGIMLIVISIVSIFILDSISVELTKNFINEKLFNNFMSDLF